MIAKLKQNFEKDTISMGELCAHFGWSPRFVEGLVRSDRLPVIEIDGELRFRRDEIVDWLQQKIQTLDAARVSDLERSIEKRLDEEALPGVSPDHHLSTWIPDGGIVLDRELATKAEVLAALADVAEKTGLVLDKRYLLASLLERESLCSTGMPGGVAFCHPRRPIPSAIRQQFVCLLRSASPVDFGAPDGEGTSLFFLLCSPDDRSHLHGLARLARVLHFGGPQDFLRAGDGKSVRELVKTIEDRL